MANISDNIASSSETKIINDISFTPREIDILACILSGRSAKKIASFLSISFRTVENHIRNIMLKINCSSQESIIDFIEKSGGYPNIKNHYMQLLMQVIFMRELKKIQLLKITHLPLITIIYNEDNKPDLPFIFQFQKHLKMLGMTIIVNTESLYLNETLSNDVSDSQQEHYFLYCLSATSLNNFNKYHAETTSISENLFFLQLAATRPKSILFLMLNSVADHELPAFLSNYLYFDLAKSGNYYILFFELLKTFFPHLALEQSLNELRKQFQLFNGSSLNKNPGASAKILKKQGWLKDCYIKPTKKMIFIVSGLSLMFITFLACSNYSNLKKLLGFKAEQTIQKTINFTGFSAQNVLTESIRAWELPRQDNRFVERKELIRTINHQFNNSLPGLNSNSLKICVCSGLGGVGKTQLALHYLHHSKQPYTLKVWFSAEHHEQLQQNMIEFAKQLGFFEQDAPFEKILTYIKQWLLKNPGWLLVYDNVNSYDDIKNFLPEAGGHIIITTCNRQWPNNFNLITVPVMKHEEAVTLVKSLVQRPIDTEEMHAIEKLTQELGFLPLALAQAGSYIENTGIKAQNYLSLYEQYEQQLLASKNMPMGVDHKPTTITWNVSLAAIEKEMNNKKQAFLPRLLLTAMSYLYPENISRHFLIEWLKTVYPTIKEPELILNEALSLLNKYSLINIHKDSISIHRLVQSVLRYDHLQNNNVSHMGPNNIAAPEWYEKLFETLDRQFWLINNPQQVGKEQLELFSQLQTLVNHYKKIWPKQKSIPFALALCDIGWISQYCFYDLHSARSYFEEALSILELSKEAQGTASKILNSLGIIYRETGQPQLAISYIEKALQRKKAIYGEKHLEIAISLNSLGITYRDIGKLEQARQLLEQALHIKEEIKGKNHIEIANTLVNLGIVYQEQNNIHAAKNFLDQALDLQLKEYPDYNNIYIGKTLTYLGSIYSTLGEKLKARDMLEQALTIREHYFGKNHINVATTLEKLGFVYQELGDLNRARSMLESVQQIKKEHTSCIQRLRN